MQRTDGTRNNVNERMDYVYRYLDFVTVLYAMARKKRSDHPWSLLMVGYNVICIIVQTHLILFWRDFFVDQSNDISIFIFISFCTILSYCCGASSSVHFRQHSIVVLLRRFVVTILLLGGRWSRRYSVPWSNPSAVKIGANSRYHGTYRRDSSRFLPHHFVPHALTHDHSVP